ncbi:S8 family peptidase [Flavihumibacter sp.]|uniref:S8 family peptidase n=1 Tax=Flavihumibacter sp. TaxID=1913981 RepID=UPI002FC90F65
MDLLNNNGHVIKDKVLINKSRTNDWDIAHNHLDISLSKEYIEPNLESKLFEVHKYGIKTKSLENDYLQNWPQPKEIYDNLVWHLNENFSQLRKAKEAVIRKVGIENCKIKIAIIDTGYQPGHPALPEGFETPKGISFINGETNQAAIDISTGTIAEQNGHGTATIAILGGKNVDIRISTQSYKGEFGAIPFAEIIPIRICDTVALIRTSGFVDAVEYAINQGCEVISMSMAGAPTKAWATVVNKAYENGVVLVTAAGNSWFKGLASISPKRVLYPARWDRVIAATGVAYNHLPYAMEAQTKLMGGNSEYMQGNYGPLSAMKSAIAAYTPNTTWATLNDKRYPFRINGAGTSSATPQIAAAAALWIIYHREKLENLLKNKPTESWKKVEMVKNALFSMADKSHPEYSKYFGKGILKSFDALSFDPSTTGLEKAKDATVSLWGIIDLLGVVLRLKSGNNEEMITRGEMFGVEILQEMHKNQKLYKFLDSDETYIWTVEEKNEIVTVLLDSPNISLRLKDYLRQGTL